MNKIKKLDIQSIENYLSKNGWCIIGYQGNFAKVWCPKSELEKEPEKRIYKEIVIPLRKDFINYYENMKISLNKIANIEDRFIDELISDINSH